MGGGFYSGNMAGSMNYPVILSAEKELIVKRFFGRGAPSE
jgi:hypothetical protein